MAQQTVRQPANSFDAIRFQFHVLVDVTARQLLQQVCAAGQYKLLAAGAYIT
jgi:hypothetical protein